MSSHHHGLSSKEQRYILLWVLVVMTIGNFSFGLVARLIHG